MPNSVDIHFMGALNSTMLGVNTSVCADVAPSSATSDLLRLATITPVVVANENYNASVCSLADTSFVNSLQLNEAFTRSLAGPLEYSDVALHGSCTNQWSEALSSSLMIWTNPAGLAVKVAAPDMDRPIFSDALSSLRAYEEALASVREHSSKLSSTYCQVISNSEVAHQRYVLAKELLHSLSEADSFSAKSFFSWHRTVENVLAIPTVGAKNPNPLNYLWADSPSYRYEQYVSMRTRKKIIRAAGWLSGDGAFSFSELRELFVLHVSALFRARLIFIFRRLSRGWAAPSTYRWVHSFMLWTGIAPPADVKEHQFSHASDLAGVFYVSNSRPRSCRNYRRLRRWMSLSRRDCDSPPCSSPFGLSYSERRQHFRSAVSDYEASLRRVRFGAVGDQLRFGNERP